MKVYTLPSRIGARTSLRRLPVVVGVDEYQVCWGKGISPQGRLNSCKGELLERAARRGIAPDVVASATELGELVVDPRRLGVDIANDWTRGNTQEYDPRIRTGWVKTTSERHGEGFVHWPSYGLPAFYQLNSNGAATHATAEAAKRTAVRELVERDAYLRWWYGFIDAEPVQPCGEHWDEIASWLAGFGWELDGYLLPGCHGVPVALCVGRRTTYGGVADAVVVGTSCRPTHGRCTTCESVQDAALEIVQFIESLELGSTVETSLSAAMRATSALKTSPMSWIACPGIGPARTTVIPMQANHICG